MSHIRIALTIIFSSLLLISCAEMREKLELMMRISKDLTTRFDHQQIHTSFGFGTETEDDHFSVTFLDFPLENADEAELEDISSKVSDYLFGKYPELQEMAYIEVRFTDQTDINELKNFFSYRRENTRSNQELPDDMAKEL
ncbi:MAG: hypothetical protein WBA74_21545 [Cyclobacteriaceae bacterium]